ncbi:MAG: histidine kinase [Clostridia bacterium]|nr:histidine kinase [Clostridia bacterium]
MIRMEIALLLVLIFIAFIYFGAEGRNTPLHKSFSALLIVTPFHLLFDAVTVYTVNHLETVPPTLNEILHRLFIGTMVIVVYLFYRYISILTEEETKSPSRVDMIAKIYLIAAELAVLLLPVHYAVTEKGNYSDGIHVSVCYISTVFYLFLCLWLLIKNRRQIDRKKKAVIGVALIIEGIVSILQAINPTWLISGIGITLMTLAFYLTLENPDILRAEITEQKMSMLYLKSQVNPHFLYNTLDTIRIQAQLNGDKTTADLLMRLSDFFRLSIKTDKQMTALEDETDLSGAYMELMCCRYPELEYNCDIDPDLDDALVPNFILQPIIENSLLHGLKNKGYRGNVTVTAKKINRKQDCIEIEVSDTGSGFDEGVKNRIDEMLLHSDKEKPKTESIGILNVQKRIKLLCGKEFGLSYTENTDGGVTAHIRLPLVREEYK